MKKISLLFLLLWVHTALGQELELQELMGMGNHFTIFVTVNGSNVEPLNAIGQKIGPYELMAVDLPQRSADFKKDGKTIRVWLDYTPEKDEKIIKVFVKWDLAFYREEPAYDATLAFIKELDALFIREHSGISLAGQRFRMRAGPEEVRRLLQAVSPEEREILYRTLSQEDIAILAQLHRNENDPSRRGQFQGPWRMPQPEPRFPAKAEIINIDRARREIALCIIHYLRQGASGNAYDLAQIYKNGLGVQGGGFSGMFWMEWVKQGDQFLRLPQPSGTREQIEYFRKLCGIPAVSRDPGSEYAEWMFVTLQLNILTDATKAAPLIDRLRRMANDGHPGPMRLLAQLIRAHRFGLTDIDEAERLEKALGAR